MPPPRSEERPPRGHVASVRNDHGKAICGEYEPHRSGRQVEIACIPKGARAELRVGIAQFGGRERFFLRQFELNGARQMCATGKAIVFDLPHLQSLIAAFEAAESVAIAAGMLPPRAGGSKPEGNA